MSTTVSFSNESSKQVTLTYEKLGCSKFAAFVEAVVWISPHNEKPRAQILQQKDGEAVINISFTSAFSKPVTINFLAIAID